jgi:hypothetical protein
VRVFWHPVPIAAMIIVALNDHLLKGSGLLPGWVTGKLSDVAGMIFFPLFALALAEALVSALAPVVSKLGLASSMRFRVTRGRLLASCAITGLFFAALKLSPLAAEIYLSWYRAVGLRAAVTPDLTDLVALLCLPIAYLVGSRRVAEAPLKVQ